MKYVGLIVFLFAGPFLFSQEKTAKLTVDKIMRDPVWIGNSPSGVFWSPGGKQLYFDWNPEGKSSDSLYGISFPGNTPRKISFSEQQRIVSADHILYNTARSAYVYQKDGDIYYTEIKKGGTKRITETAATETYPVFSFNESAIVYQRDNELYSWTIGTGETKQLIGIEAKSMKNEKDSTPQQLWLTTDRLAYFDIIKSRKEKKDQEEAYRKLHEKEKRIRKIILDGKEITNIRISPTGRFISYSLEKIADNVKKTIVPAFITESGYTEDIPARTKVGSPEATSEFFIYDRQLDTIIKISTDSIPGIRDIPVYIKENYPKKAAELVKKNQLRSVTIAGPCWSPEGTYAVIDIFSEDNKDRWLMLLDPANGKLKLLDRQHDDAWIGGPGISASMTNKGWINETDLWFYSEVTGYSHLYSIDVFTGEKKALTSGQYEVQKAKLSFDRTSFYITTNEVHPGEQQFYRLSISSGKKDRITTMPGSNQVTISPDEKNIAILYSYSNKPWELYLQENKPRGKLTRLTQQSESEEFKSYPWREPELISFKARDSTDIFARVYKPSGPRAGAPAVIFVHGAGYLQNAHKWWSSYFREYLFHNLLADNGYFVMDIDYRGSAGYGRNWRTGIYRYMGGKDLTDHIDAADFLVKHFGVDPARIGIYGGSYGGFITLMALFTAPDVFAAGAALRPVTNWANYNQGYTSNILNEPANDSIAYRRSSPIYFAEGLKSHLLICHGMIDVNVHFQDAIELAQRLIELKKENWELAVYPMEDHGFEEPSSWTDEYKRIFKLFERVLKSPR